MKKSYTPLPAIPKDLSERYQVLKEVLAGAMTVSEGARKLRISRNHFQSLMHRGEEGFIQGVSPKRAGRRAMPLSQRALLKLTERQQQEIANLRLQVETRDQLLQVARVLVRGHTLKAKGSKTPPEEE